MLFHYTRSRKQTARMVILNMFVVPLYLFGLKLLTDSYPEVAEIWPYAVYATITIEVILLVFAAWLLKNPDAFEIKVTPTVFEVYHPTFSEWCFSVVPQDIERIDHHTDTHQHIWINVVEENGEKHRLCTNYAYSRKKLYEALKALNPAIKLPKNINRFYRKPTHDA